MVGDGDAVGIAAEILRDVLGSAEGWFGVDDPIFAEERTQPGEKRIANLDRSYRAPAVALSQVRRTDGRRRTIHRRHNSNFVLHRSWSQLHEITRPQPQLLARFSALRRSVSPSPLDTFFMPQSRFRFNRHFALAHARRSSATDLDHPDNLYKPLLLHSICISTAPAAPAASF